jgi:Protein of unknown function (DUF2752)
VVDSPPEELSLRLSKKSRMLRYGILGLAATPLAGSWLYIHGYRLGLIFCPVRHWAGVICPSCGMTRSFMAIARGDWYSAIDHHLFGPLLFIGFGLALVHSIWELSLNRQVQIFYLQWLNRRDVQSILLTSFLIYYLLRLNQIIPSHHI